MSNNVPFFSHRFLFVRHGESEANQQRLFAGSWDVELTDKGVEQALESAKNLKGEAIGSVFASPMRRTWKTAKVIADALGGFQIEPIPGITERNYGEWERKSNVNMDRSQTPPGGESPEEFNSRTISALKPITGQPSILLIAHSGTFRALHDYLLGVPVFNSVKNGIPIAFIPPKKNNDPWTFESLGDSDLDESNAD